MHNFYSLIIELCLKKKEKEITKLRKISYTFAKNRHDVVEVEFVCGVMDGVSVFTAPVGLRPMHIGFSQKF